jgi:hypothetical protein
VCIAVALVPVAVQLHELAHFVTDLAFGHPDPALHYASAGFAGEQEFWSLVRRGEWAAANQIVNVRHAGISALSGLLVSYLLIGAGVWRATRASPVLPLAIALGSAARFPLVLLLYAFGRAEHTDEAHVSQALGVPLPLMFGIAAAALLAATVAGWRILRRRSGTRLVLPLFAGVVAGTVLWIGIVGPAVLP